MTCLVRTKLLPKDSFLVPTARRVARSSHSTSLEKLTSFFSLARAVLARTCGELGDVARPLLQKRQKSWENLPRFHFQFIAYLRTILTNRELARQETCFTADWRDPFRRGPLQTGDLEMLDAAAAARAPGMPHPSTWLRDMNEHDLEADEPQYDELQCILLQLILLNLPNLQTLELPDDFRDIHHLPAGSLPSLKTLVLRPESGNPFQDDDFTPSRHLGLQDSNVLESLSSAAPRLEHLILRKLWSSAGDRFPTLRNLSSLEFRDSILKDPSVLRSLGCVRLQRFTYDSTGYDDTSESDMGVRSGRCGIRGRRGKRRKRRSLHQ